MKIGTTISLNRDVYEAVGRYSHRLRVPRSHAIEVILRMHLGLPVDPDLPEAPSVSRELAGSRPGR